MMVHTISCHSHQDQQFYEIHIHQGILKLSQLLAKKLKLFGSTFALITDETVANLYGHDLKEALSKEGLEINLFSFPAGEKFKTRATKEHLENQMFEKNLGKDTCILALGGGIVTDLSGYIAATYCRGIPLVLTPTSLLGMVDASIGGKNGVNTPHGKNLLGCIYPPKEVIIDPSILKSLPLRELKNGFVEMIKHALILDATYFEFLEKHSRSLLSLDPVILNQAILESCYIKKKIVEEDEKETGKRRLLNFGHTVGHALEKLSFFSLSHGEAVAIGLLVESHLSMQLGLLDNKSLLKIKNILELYEIPITKPLKHTKQQILDAMTLDKKSLSKRPRFVSIKGIGSAVSYQEAYCTHVEASLIENALEWASL